MVKGRLIEVREITRIEGHLDLEITIGENNEVNVKAAVKEGTRILRRILIGRDYWEIPEIASRMCGVCSVIHRVTAAMAIENALGIEPSEDIRLLRELMVVGGHIQSHLIHLFYFTIPDYLGANSIIIGDARKYYLPLIRSVMSVKKWANSIVERLGGRAVHPISPVVGGLSRLPSRIDLVRLLEDTKKIKETAMELAREILKINYPDFPTEKNFVSLRGDGDIPLLVGTVDVCGERIDPVVYPGYIRYIDEKYSTAPHFLLKNNEPFMVGALARLNNNYSALKGLAKDICSEYGIKYPDYSIFTNNQSQALEILYFIEKTEDILEKLARKKNIETSSRTKRKKNTGIAVTEAPRGLLIHEYGINDNGKVVLANIITPTAQNLKSIERRVEELVRVLLGRGVGPEELKKNAEKLVRSYDPCISCAARFRKNH